MVVSDPTIDSITGLPLLNPNTPIQQIPLGADVFPFADLKASAQPARGPIYGDDIIPTSSLLSGQHPTLGNAQTVQTDGSHAAKVYVVNPSGGGGGPAPYYITPYAKGDHSDAGGAYGGDLGSIGIGQSAILVGFHAVLYSLVPAGATGPTVESLQVALSGAVSGNWNAFVSVYLLKDATTAGTLQTYTIAQDFSDPWDLTKMYPGDTSVSIPISSTSWRTALSVTLFVAYRGI